MGRVCSHLVEVDPKSLCSNPLLQKPFFLGCTLPLSAIGHSWTTVKQIYNVRLLRIRVISRPDWPGSRCPKQRWNMINRASGYATRHAALARFPYFPSAPKRSRDGHREIRLQNKASSRCWKYCFIHRQLGAPSCKGSLNFRTPKKQAKANGPRCRTRVWRWETSARLLVDLHAAKWQLAVCALGPNREFFGKFKLCFLAASVLCQTSGRFCRL